MNENSSGVGMIAIEESIAVRAARWIEFCGGVAVWKSREHSSPMREFFTPVHRTDGSPASRPHWSVADSPDRIVTRLERIEVVERREFSRVRIAVRKGYGLRLVLSDAATERLHAALEKAGHGASYLFEGNEAIVCAVVRRVSLMEWMKEHPHAQAI